MRISFCLLAFFPPPPFTNATMLALYFALSILAASNAMTITNYDDIACSVASSSFQITNLGGGCQLQTRAQGTFSVKVSAISCSATAGVTYNYAVCSSNDCSGGCGGSSGGIVYTAAQYAQYLASNCTVQTVDGDPTYIKATNTPLDVCTLGSASLTTPSALVLMLAIVAQALSL